MSPPITTDFDGAWKFALEQFFPDFLTFFFPEAFTAIDWRYPISFRPTELQQIAPDDQQGKQRADTLVAVQRLGHANFIHPQLGRLVRVNVVNARCHSNDDSADDCYCKVVPWVREELSNPFSIYWTVKDIGGYGIQHRQLIGPEYSDRNFHCFKLASSACLGRSPCSAAGQLRGRQTRFPTCYLGIDTPLDHARPKTITRGQITAMIFR